MADVPINPLTNKPASGPGLVDQYYRKEGVRPPYSILKNSDKLIDTLESMSTKEAQQFLADAERQLDAYYDSLESNPEDQKRLSQILKGDLDAKGALVSYGNLKRNFGALTQLLQSKKLQEEETAGAVKKPLLAQIRKNGIEVKANASPEELQQKAVELWLKLKVDCENAGGKFYHRVAWAMWKSPKSTGMDKLVARDYLDAAWYAASLQSPLTGRQLTRPGLFNQLLRDEIQREFKPSGLTPFVTHKAFYESRKTAMDFLEKVPEKFQKLLESSEKRGSAARGIDLEFLPYMRGFSRRAFTAQSLDAALNGYAKETPSKDNTLPLDEAFQAFQNYYFTVTQPNTNNPANPINLIVGGPLNSLIWRENPSLKNKLVQIVKLQEQARDEKGNVTNKTAEKHFEKELHVFFLKLAEAIKGDKRFTPEEKAIAADYMNAFYMDQKSQKAKSDQKVKSEKTRGTHA